MLLPTPTDDVQDVAATLGVTIAPTEVEDYQTLLNEADEVFNRLLTMPEYHIQCDTIRFPRSNIHAPTTSENVHGVAWSHKFSVGGGLNSNPDGLLHGMTFCLKDNICVAQVPQLNGTEMVKAWIPEIDATVVTRILHAGGEIIGTATCENMSYSPSSDTSAAGIIHNPYGQGFSAGGSSSGVGALVGSVENHVDAGIGADQGGSIRIPAAMSGCVGLKATHGLIPYTGVISSEAIMDHVGPICKNVMDCAKVLEVIAGRDFIDDRGVGAHEYGAIHYSSDILKWYDESTLTNPGKPLVGMKIGIIKESMDSPFLQAQMRNAVEVSAYRLKELGAEVEEVSMPSHITGRDMWYAIRRLGGSQSLRGQVTSRKVYNPTTFLQDLYSMNQEMWDKTCTAVKSTMINGSYAMAKYPTLYAKCLNLAIQLSAEYETLLKNYTVLITPTVSRTAPKLSGRDLGPLAQTQSDQGLAMNTAQFNLTGHPAMALPIGFLPDPEEHVMLPVSMQIIGPLHEEHRILKIGYAYEKAFDWRQERFV